MIRSYDDLLKINCKKLYLYGARNVAMEIRGFFERNGIDFEGYIVSKLEGNKPEICGKPVRRFDELKNTLSEISILVACVPNFKKDIGNALFSAGARKVFFLDNAFAWILQYQAKSRKSFNDFAVGYEMGFPMNIERGQGLIRQRDSKDSFRIRTELGQLDKLIQFSDKSLFKIGALKQEFENCWNKFVDIKNIPRVQKINSVKDAFNVFSIRCHVDRLCCNLKNESFLTEIQAGAAIAPFRICNLGDDSGQNISDRNKDFSECSAIYWAWKNASDKEYTGCMHYRRHLDITEEDLFAAQAEGLDLVNTVPCIIYPNVKDFFRTIALFDLDIECVLETVQKLYPDYLRSTIQILEGHYYLANNIMIMRSSWFKRMCEFVFDILLYVDDTYRKSGLIREDRYAGYIFEFLYSVFVFHHAKEMKIAFADMNAMVL